MLLTLRISIEVVHKVGDGVVERCSRDAIVVLAVVHKLEALSLVHSYQDVVVQELPLVVQVRNDTLRASLLFVPEVLSLKTQY